MVLVIGALGAWGRGKTMTLTMIQELAKTTPWELEMSEPPIIVSNFQSIFMDAYLAIDPKVDVITFTPKADYPPRTVPVINFIDFLKRPRSTVPIFMFLDDVYGWLASYFFGSDFNKTAFRLLASGRKKNINIAESSVRFKDVDPRLRALHSHLFVPKYIKEGEIVSVERYLVDAFDDIKLSPDIYYDAPRYFNAYDTDEIIENVYDNKTVKDNMRAIGGQQIASGALDFSGIDKQPTSRPITDNILPATPPLNRDVAPAIFETAPAEKPKRIAAIPDGYAAIANGIIIQNKIGEEYRAKGFYIRQGWKTGEPDIILYKDRDQTNPAVVISVKSFYIVKSSDRWKSVTPIGVSVGVDIGGVGVGDIASGSVARTIYRRDIDPEIRASSILQVPCVLVVVNLRNGRREDIHVQPDFQKYTTSQGLNAE